MELEDRRERRKAKSSDGKPRDQWSNPIEFLLSCIAMSVGLGNVWRFPYVAYKNGGGAFLIPYMVILLLIGKPLYYLELAIGQFSSFGCVRMWNVVPAFRGIGYGQMIGSSAVVSYYVSIMAITVFYLVASFSSTLPWTMCDPDLVNMTTCVGVNTNVTALFGNGTRNVTLISAADAYYKKNVLRAVSDLDNGVGLPEWRLVTCLLVAWLAILLTIVKGIKSSGKVAYFTALFPYVVLVSLLIRGVTLPGAVEGILFYLKPRWWKILELKVWMAALTQCFFSLSVGFGVISMFASFNKFSHNVARDATIISTMDMLTSFLSGFTIFSILGNLAHELGTDVETVAEDSSGTQLAFVSYPRALANFPVPQLFSVLFFLMLFTLGLGSASALISCPITVICDNFPRLARWKVSTVICAIGFLIGIVYITPGGELVLNLVDYFGAGFTITVLAMLEIIALGWIYGIPRICSDITTMLGRPPNIYWKVCWVFFMPIILIAAAVYTMTKLSPEPNEVEYNTPAIVGGWTLAIAALLPVPICFIYEVYRSSETGLIRKVKKSMQPNRQWGPVNEEDRRLWLQQSGLSPEGLKGYGNGGLDVSFNNLSYFQSAETDDVTKL